MASTYASSEQRHGPFLARYMFINGLGTRQYIYDKRNMDQWRKRVNTTFTVKMAYPLQGWTDLSFDYSRSEGPCVWYKILWSILWLLRVMSGWKVAVGVFLRRCQVVMIFDQFWLLSTALLDSIGRFFSPECVLRRIYIIYVQRNKCCSMGRRDILVWDFCGDGAQMRRWDVVSAWCALLHTIVHEYDLYSSISCLE